MNVLVIDVECMNLDFVLKCVEAGHAVRWYRWSRRPVRDGEGFKGFTVVNEWQPHMGWARDGLVFVTGNFVHIHELDRYRSEFGYSVFGPTVASARLEIDRAYGMETLQAAGVPTLEHCMFDSLESARTFARSSDRTWVFKPTGDSDDKKLTYVAHDPADMVGWLDRQIAGGKRLKGACMLQEKVEALVEIGVSGWFGPEGFLPNKWQVCFEHKRLMNGDVGPNTGEQGTVCQYVADDKLANDMLLPLEPILKALGHRGDFAVGAMVDTAGRAWPLEFTARSGYPAWYIQMASHRGDPATWMRDLLGGKDSLRVLRSVAIGVVMAQPQYPYNRSPAELVEGHPIRLQDVQPEDLHFVSVMRGRGATLRDGKIHEAMQLQTSGEYVMVATGLGSDVARARMATYATVKSVHFPNAMYRTDIGESLSDSLPKLHKHGFALDMEYGKETR